MVFWSSFHCSRLAPEGAYVDGFCRTCFDEPFHRLLPVSRLSGMRTEAFVAGADEIQHSFEAHVPDGLLRFSRCTLHQATDQVKGDQAHPQGFVSHGRAFHREELHAQGGFEIA